MQESWSGAAKLSVLAASTQPGFPPASTVAILLFARSAEQKAAHKQFVSHGGRAANTTVAAQLTAHATTTAQQVEVDFLLVDSSRQAGATFGEQLSGTMQQGFAKGYEQLIVIGSNCPQLDAAMLHRAVATLARTGAVLGPATDDGVYLLGVARTHFNAATWARLPWQTPTLGQELSHSLSRVLRWLLRPRSTPMEALSCTQLTYWRSPTAPPAC